MRVLVTGAAGFLGQHVVAALRARGHTVRALVRQASRVEALGWPAEVELFRADLRAPGDLAPAFSGVDAVVHLAAAVTGGEDAQFAAGVVGTEKLLAAMAASGVRRLVFASSFSVYDWSRVRRRLDELSPVLEAPMLYERDGYAVAKTWQERVVRRAAERHGLDLTVLRPGFIWGRDHGYLACLGQAIGKNHLTIGPWTRLPLTHVENCADVFALAVDCPGASGQILNVVDGDDVRTWRYLGDFLRGTGTPWRRVPVPYLAFRGVVALAYRTIKWIFDGKGKLPGLLVPCRVEARFKPVRFPNAKLRAALGWTPRLSYEECLERTYPPAAPAPVSSASAPAVG
jgi:UDP-glucose 4-epimerase